MEVTIKATPEELTQLIKKVVSVNTETTNRINIGQYPLCCKYPGTFSGGYVQPNIRPTSQC